MCKREAYIVPKNAQGKSQGVAVRLKNLLRYTEKYHLLKSQGAALSTTFFFFLFYLSSLSVHAPACTL